MGRWGGLIAKERRDAGGERGETASSSLTWKMVLVMGVRKKARIISVGIRSPLRPLIRRAVPCDAL